MMFSFLEAAATKYGLDSVEELLKSILPEAPGETDKAVRKAIDQAAETFHNRYGDRYGKRNESFLVRKENVETILLSTLPGNDLLTAGDLDGDGFQDAEKAPLNVREHFVELFHDEMSKDRRLAWVLERQRQRQKADERWEHLFTMVETIRQSTENEEWFGSVGSVPRRNYLMYLHDISDRFEEYAEAVTLDVVPAAVGRNRRSEGRELVQGDRSRFGVVQKMNGSLLLTGPPGSGKSVMVRQFLNYAAVDAAAGPLIERGFVEDQAPIPVYVTPGRGNVFDRIAHSLHANGLGDRPFSEGWVREALGSGVLLVMVDDAHRFDPGELMDLLDYRRSSPIVILSRDRAQLPQANLPHYRVAQLTNEQAEAILDRILEDRVRAFYFEVQRDEHVRALGKRPQTLSLLAHLGSNYNRLPDDRFGLFEQAFLERHSSELGQGNVLDESWFKERILGALALYIVQSTGSYSASIPEARKAITSSLRRLNEEGHGIDSVRTQTVLMTLRQQGHLIVDGGSMRFQHDRWLEFHAAKELVRTETPLSNLVSEEAQREIAFFASALATLEAERQEQKEFWDNFWSFVAHLDPFWAFSCRDQQPSSTFTSQGWKKFRDQLPTPSESEIKRSFGAYIKEYVGVRDRHFPNMTEVFPPHSHGRIGVLVEREQGKLGYRHGFLRVGPDAPKVEIVDDLEFEYEGGVKKPSFILESSSDPALGTPPAVVALYRLKRAMRRALSNDFLWEPQALLRERVYFEAVALYRANIKQGRRPTEIPFSFDPLELDRELRQSRSRPREGKIELSNLAGTDREVKFSEWLETLMKANDRSIPLRPLSPPVPPPWKVIPACDGGPLSDVEIDRLSDWSTDYYKCMYQTLKVFIERGFPTTKKSFRSYGDTFPVLILLVLGNREEGEVRRPKNVLSRAFLGEVWTIQRRDEDAPPVEVRTVDAETEAHKIADEVTTGNGWRTGWSVRFRPSIPPLHHGVYREVRRDLRKLLNL